MAYEEFDDRYAHEGRRNVMDVAHDTAAARNAPDEPAPRRPGPIGGTPRVNPGAIAGVVIAVVVVFAFIASIVGRQGAAVLPDASEALWPTVEAPAPAVAPAQAQDAPTPAPLPTGFLEPVNAPAPVQAAPADAWSAPVAPPVVYSELVPLPTPEAPGWHAPMAPGYDPNNYVEVKP